MRLHNIIYIMLLALVLAMSSCGPMYGRLLTPTHLIIEASKTPSVEPLSLTPIFESSNPNTVTATYEPSFIEGYSEKELICDDYIETTWGGGDSQWGDPVQIARSHDMVAPLVFNAQNEIYFADYVNQRLLKYNGIDPLPVQKISLPARYFSAPEHETVHNPWLAIAVSQSSIIIPYGNDKLGLLSLNGQEIKDIQLPYHFNFMAPLWQPVWIAPSGGLLVNGEKVVYFDPGWELGNWSEVSSGNDFIRNPFWWNGYIGGESGVQSKIYKYNLDSSTDFLKESVEINTDLGPDAHLIGLDKNGWLYFEKIFTSGYAFARYGIETGKKQFGMVSDEIASQTIQASVSLDGTIYLISYDHIDPSVQPKIIKCDISE